jgi:hypothetical protein
MQDTYSTIPGGSASPQAAISRPRPIRNGRPGHPHDRQLRDVVGWLIADLKAVDQLRHDELRKLRGLRHEIYSNAREVGVSPALLRALALTHRSNGRSRDANGGNGHGR